ncbi:MAG: bifunctional phosphoserine phosphatase/homoserine phosphotransferase ThrH [Spirochaetes bacterium]|nr:bifunctional phosphoserine phosphatase/homoserine phosphotransferase ThrH [Spirochaetota bacterium]
MIIACLDLEGVLVPEIWINVSEQTGVKELRLTTRDISNYDKLMKHRIKILRENNIKLNDIKNVINKMVPLSGAVDFYNKLKENFQVIILSDTYYQFAMPLMKQLNYPTLFCHNLMTDSNDYIIDYKLRITESKKESVLKLKELNFLVIAAGDSYNDIAMLKAADKGILFKPPENVIKEYPQFTITNDYNGLFDEFIRSKELLKEF